MAQEQAGRSEFNGSSNTSRPVRLELSYFKYHWSRVIILLVLAMKSPKHNNCKIDNNMKDFTLSYLTW